MFIPGNETWPDVKFRGWSRSGGRAAVATDGALLLVALRINHVRVGVCRVARPLHTFFVGEARDMLLTDDEVVLSGRSGGRRSAARRDARAVPLARRFFRRDGDGAAWSRVAGFLEWTF